MHLAAPFGFKTGLGTADALFIIRRLLERVWTANNESGMFLALDWARAFDSIAPEALLTALKRFGLPNHFCSIVAEIYSSREFRVAGGVGSEARSQLSGISQCCPLSPYLFVILMSVMLHDAQQRLREVHGIVIPTDAVSELIYADDTLLVGANAGTISKYLTCVVEVGLENGLEMNWKKVELMSVKCSSPLTTPEGQLLESKDAFIYLGSLLTANGDVNSELARRLGMAQGDFNRIHQVWCHSGLSLQEKYKVCISCIVSRLLHGLQVIWLDQAARNKLDAFHARSLRRILGIAPSFWSRISNKGVLDRIEAPKLSRILLEQQLGFLGTLARRPDTCPVQKFVFGPQLSRKPVEYKRRQGRPNIEWVAEVFKVVDQLFTSTEMFHGCILNKQAWRNTIRVFCRRQDQQLLSPLPMHLGC